MMWHLTVLWRGALVPERFQFFSFQKAFQAFRECSKWATVIEVSLERRQAC